MLLTREQFRTLVFARDKGKCVLCGASAVDAHHIIERRLWPDGGYYLDNGASVCSACHYKCETTEVSVEVVRNAAKVKTVAVPPGFLSTAPMTKWGDPLLPNGQRMRGPLFHEESVQKVLAAGKVLHMYTPYVKYPRTFHLPWSRGAADDDKILSNVEHFRGREVVVTEKMDGENTTAYADGHIHARSIDSKSTSDRAWVLRYLSTEVCPNLPDGWRVCGENLWARHSIAYDALPTYFMAFSLWTSENVCLSWVDTLEYLGVLGVSSVPVLARGRFEDVDFKAIEKGLDFSKTEGYVVRLADAFNYSDFAHSVAKFVRPNHVTTDKHWRTHITPNTLKAQ